MKYAVFSLAAIGVFPLAFALSANRRWMKYAIWAMIAALALFQATSINFFSHEDYRGSSRGMEVSLAYLMALALVLAAAVRGRFPGFLPSAGMKLYAAYFLLCLPSWTSAENLLFCWMETWKMLMMYLVYLGVRSYLAATDGAGHLVKALAFFAIWNFLAVVKEHFCGVYQPEGVFPHQNSMVMAMHLFGGLFFALYAARGWRSARLAAIAFAASAAAGVRSYSRAAIALMPLSYALAALLLWWKGSGAGFPRLLKRLAPFAAAGFAALMLMLPRIIERFETAPEASGATRVELARCAVEMMRDEPWRGVGVNNWGIKINPPWEYAEAAGRTRTRGEDFKDGIVETVYLLVGAECGIPALVLMVLWLLHYLVLSLRLVWRLAPSTACCVAAGLAGGLLACYAQSCLEWVLRQQTNLALLMLFFALLDHLNAHWREYAAGKND
ncbi:MAG: O-antigen ligase family protein [Kiritimatiellae bacterium]|nr:O-antigen ligase family protein [Kiritimatiellia bacterium]